MSRKRSPLLRCLAVSLLAVAAAAAPRTALLLTCFKPWPERALGAVVCDPTKLWEYDPETGSHSSTDD